MPVDPFEERGCVCWEVWCDECGSDVIYCAQNYTPTHCLDCDEPLIRTLNLTERDDQAADYAVDAARDGG